jgi:Tat protein secretion system quality control protein TatD with DNase activity
VPVVGAAVAAIRGVREEDVAALTSANATTVFRLF